MTEPRTIKRIAFWLLVAAAALLLVAGLALATWLVLDAGKPLDNIAALVIAGGYLLAVAIKAPGVTLSVIGMIALYSLAVIKLAQNKLEQRLRWFAIPAAIFGLWVGATTVFTAVVAGLASQGAGQ